MRKRDESGSNVVSVHVSSQVGALPLPFAQSVGIASPPAVVMDQMPRDQHPSVPIETGKLGLSEGTSHQQPILHIPDSPTTASTSAFIEASTIPVPN